MMKVQVEFGYASGDGGRLAERLGFANRHMEVEASTAREAFAFLRSQSPVAQEVFELRFSHVGILNGSWMIILNRGNADAKGIKSEADLDAPLKEGDSIYITSAATGG